VILRKQNVFTEVKPDYVINLAAISSVGLSWKIPEKTMEVNIIGTINILDAAYKVIPNAKIMLIGSSEEYEQSDKPLKEEDIVNANNPYGISKVAAENVAKMYKDKCIAIYSLKTQELLANTTDLNIDIKTCKSKYNDLYFLYMLDNKCVEITGNARNISLPDITY